MSETCKNCGHVIGKEEQSYVYHDAVVCMSCHDKLNFIEVSNQVGSHADSVPNELFRKIFNALKKPIGIIFLVIGMSVAGVLARGLSRSINDTKQSVRIEKALAKRVNRLNLNLPMMVGKEIKVSSMLAGPGKRLTYNCTIINYAANEVDEAALEAIIGNNVKNRVISAPEMKLLFEDGITIIYRYEGKNGVYISGIEITPSDAGY